MIQKNFKESKLPLIVSGVVFLLVLTFSLYLSYQQYLISKKREHELLLHELSNVKDKFRNILYNDITAAHTLVIMYKEYGNTSKNFDKIAQQIIKNSKYVEVIQLTKAGIITNVYPLKGYENTIGINTLDDKMRQQEAKNALTKKNVFFAGPRKLRQGGIGILGKVPIIIDNKIEGYCVVLTKLHTIKEALRTTDNKKNKFSYILSKNIGSKNQSDFLLTDTKPSKNSELVSVEIPEGDWVLSVGYNQNFITNTSHYKMAVFGLILSIITTLLVYRKSKERKKLQEMVDASTLLLKERVKEISTIYKINNLLLNEDQDIDEMFSKIVNLLPDGWQYPEICEAKISFNGKEYKTNGYKISKFSQKANVYLDDNQIGNIEVIYTEERPLETEGPFFQEERDLINSIAKTIEIYLNKIAQKEALNKSEKLFRVAFEMASTGLSMVTLDGSWLKVNNALCEMLGYSEAEFLNLNYQQITYFDDLKEDLELHQLLLNGEKDTYRIEKRYIHKNGSIVWANLNVAVIKDNNNQPLFFVSQIENITERVESQNKFRDLVEKSLVGIYILVDGKMVYVNPEIIKEGGYEENELLNQSIENFIFEEDLPIARQKIKERLLGITNEVRYEIRIKKKDGSYLWNEVFGVSTTYQGKPAIIGTMVNINEKKNLELERLNIITDLTQRNQDLEQFSYIVSHNIRGPIANLLGLSNILENDNQTKDLDFLYKSIKKTTIALDDVITDVNKILSTRKDFLQTKSEIDLNEIISKIKLELQNNIEQSKTKITCDFSAVNSLYSIAPYIHSIFLNLISNSIKYTEFGTIPEIKIWSEIKDNQIKIYFKDNGIGIDLKRHGSHIFGLYKRFNLEKEGKGLGLFMVKTQTTALNGTIEIESELGNGTLFIVSFPL